MLEQARHQMVEQHLRRRGISDQRVLAAFDTVPRELFVPPEQLLHAYADEALPIGGGQTISQPYIVAVTLEALQLHGGERVLEVGTGSGYAAALLGQIAAEVYTIERHPKLAAEARSRLELLCYDNVHVITADGTLGDSEHAPFDAIAVAAGGPDVPPALVQQLTPGGRLVMPVGPHGAQVLVRATRSFGGRLKVEPLVEVQFVPLVGAQGWPSAQ